MKIELDALVQQMVTRGIMFEEAVKEFEKNFILQVLTRNHDNLSKAASELGIHRNTLSKRLVEYQNGNHQLTPAKRNGHQRRQVAPRRKIKK